MHCIEAPQSRAVTATEDGRTYHYSKGATLFASGYLAYDKLDTDQRQLARSLLVNYGVHPFKRVHGLPMSRLGLRVINDDQDYTRHYEQAKEDTGCMRHPLVWKHPVTGRLALMGHTRCMLSMESIHGEWFDVEASRALLEDMYSRAVRPEFVHAVNHESGDLTLWDNFSVWHTATGGLEPEDRRVCHLCALNGSLEPEGAQ